MHNTITEAKLFKPGDRVAIGASGGKGVYPSSELEVYSHQAGADSTVLAYVMKTLNDRYQYGLELFLLSIDEGITGYRDDSLEVHGEISSNQFYADHYSRPSSGIRSNMTCL